MPSSSFVFTGHPAYLEAAARQLGQPDQARAAGRLVALSSLANLCAQASRARPTDAAAILAKASEFRDQIAIALKAANAMLADVEFATLLALEPPTTAGEVAPDDEADETEAGPAPELPGGSL